MVGFKNWNLVAALFVSVSAFADGTTPHLEFDLSSQQYRALLRQQATLNNEMRPALSTAANLQDVIKLGERNLQWFEAINAPRPAHQKLELSTPETQPGYPMDRPRESSPTLIRSRLAQLKSEMPVEMWNTLTGTGSLPSKAPADDTTYLTMTRRLDSIYQAASRWILQEPYLFSYTQRASEDVRGYYFLSQEKDLESKLKNPNSLTPEDKSRLSAWLVGECRNSSASLETCQGKVNQAWRQLDGAWRLHQTYSARGARLWKSFFELQNPREESRWTAKDPDTLWIGVENPQSRDVAQWLVTNVEDEWRQGSWHLRLDLRSESNSNLVRVRFEPAATPHVDGLGGDTITMDANRPIQEYDTRWTIRHEFGHTLGFPDCYIEFFDQPRGIMVSYQLDTTNLMCSRQGHIQPKHVDELKAKYYRGR